MKIIFFDGNCPMCHSWVKRLIRWDKKKIFRFSPLDGAVAQEILTPIWPEYKKEDTIILYEDGKAFLRSDAGIKIMKSLGFPYSLIVAGWIIPKSLRDLSYRWIADRRYKYGKRYESCPLPPVEWRERFI